MSVPNPFCPHSKPIKRSPRRTLTFERTKISGGGGGGERERVSSGGKGVAAVTSATWVRFALGRTIYIVWVPGKEAKTSFYLSKKKISGAMNPRETQSFVRNKRNY